MPTIDHISIYNFLCEKYRDSICPSQEILERILESFYDQVHIDLYNDKEDSLRFTSQSSFLDEVEFSGEIISKGTKYYFSVLEYSNNNKWRVVSWESEDHRVVYRLR